MKTFPNGLMSLFITMILLINPLFAVQDIVVGKYDAFDGAQIDPSSTPSQYPGGTVFNIPSPGNGVQSWAGFVAGDEDTATDSMFPFIFSVDGKIIVTAAVSNGGDATLKFRFQAAAYPNHEPEYDVLVPITGAQDTYEVDIPAYGDQEFHNLVFYIEEKDTPVEISEIQILSDVYVPPPVDPDAPLPGATTINNIPVSYWTPFGGSNATISEDFIFEWPDNGTSWAGFAIGGAAYLASDPLDIPFAFTSDGSLQFTASVPGGGSASVRFVFERKPYNAEGGGAADTMPNYVTENITITGDTPTVYNITIPEQGNNTFESFLFYINDRNTPVKLGEVVVTDDEGVPGATTRVSFRIEKYSGGGAENFTTSTQDITVTTPGNFEIDIPAYANNDDEWLAYVLNIGGPSQSVAINDVILEVNDAQGVASVFATDIVFETEFGGKSPVVQNSDGNVYSHAENSGGGYLYAIAAGNGPTLGYGGKIKFTASLVDTPTDVVYAPEVDGESAINSDGTINTSEDTGDGRPPNDPYRWSGHMQWYYPDSLDSSEGNERWGMLGDLSATWDQGVITIKPNTNGYEDSELWRNDTDTDGAFYIVQTLKIEGNRATSAILGKTVTFTGNVTSNTLNSRYGIKAFVKAEDPESGYTTVVEQEFDLQNHTGEFTVSAALPSGDYVPKLGFVLTGTNASPDADWGDIQISNVAATYDETTPIQGGNFTEGQGSYWGFDDNDQFFSGNSVEFSTTDGYGAIPGQVTLTNVSDTGVYVYVASNQLVAEPLANFGMQAGMTYDVTYFMKLVGGVNVGALQFEFFNASGGSANSSYNNSSYSPTLGDWVQYTETIEVPEWAVNARFYLISGAESVVSFDRINVTAVDNFSNWAILNGLSGTNSAKTADPDYDGISNDLEAYLGTDPLVASDGISNLLLRVEGDAGVSFEHPASSNYPSEFSGSYEWSTNLSDWNASGDEVGGTTVDINSSVLEGVATVSATISGDDPENLFIRLSITDADE